MTKSKTIPKNKEIVILGASANPKKNSYITTDFLNTKGFSIHAYGNKKGTINNIPLETKVEPLENIDTVSMFSSPDEQIKYYDYIIELNPKRIIFNPGTENKELERIAKKNNIEVVKACTIAMLMVNAL